MRFVRLALIGILLLSILVLVPSSNSLAAVEPIPMEREKMAEVNQAFYLSDMEYQDESLHITIEKGRIHETNYLVARIKIADPSQIRSAIVSANGKGSIVGASLAKRVNAVFAINGDFYSSNKTSVGKHIIRQGILKKHNAKGGMDALIIDEKGNLTIIPAATEKDFETFEGTIVNSYAFGPGLVINGELITEFNEKTTSAGIAAFKSAQRMCIAQVGELEYICLASEGPEDQGSVGLTIPQLAKLIYSFGNVQNAYNLDGGSSSTMVFNNQKINSPNNPKRRPLADIIYFASAYAEE